MPETQSRNFEVEMAAVSGWLAVALGIHPLRTYGVILRIDDGDWLDESDESNNEFIYP